MPLLPRHPLRIQPYFGHRSHERLVISARALRARDPGFDKRSRLRAMETMVRQFISHEVAGVAVKLEIAGNKGTLLSHEGITDGEGFVHFDIAIDPQWD